MRTTKKCYSNLESTNLLRLQFGDDKKNGLLFLSCLTPWEGEKNDTSLQNPKDPVSTKKKDLNLFVQPAD